MQMIVLGWLGARKCANATLYHLQMGALRKIRCDFGEEGRWACVHDRKFSLFLVCSLFTCVHDIMQRI
jgi:hypothetical protein